MIEEQWPLSHYLEQRSEWDMLPGFIAWSLEHPEGEQMDDRTSGHNLGMTWAMLRACVEDMRDMINDDEVVRIAIVDAHGGETMVNATGVWTTTESFRTPQGERSIHTRITITGYAEEEEEDD